MDSPPPWSCFPSPPFDAASTESTDAFRSVSSTPGPVTDSSPWSQPSPSLELLANNGQSPDVSGGWEYDTQAVWGDDSRMGLSMDSLRNVATNKGMSKLALSSLCYTHVHSYQLQPTTTTNYPLGIISTIHPARVDGKPC